MATVATPEEVNAFHLNSDKDSSVYALHHTLGTKPTQAAPGNHSHNGIDSVRIKLSDIEGSWMNIDGGRPDTIYTPIPSIDGGGI
jgi:hypothetical protein